MNLRLFLHGSTVLLETAALVVLLLGSALNESMPLRPLLQLGIAPDAMSGGLALALHIAASMGLAVGARHDLAQCEFVPHARGGRQGLLRGLFFLCIAFCIPLIGVCIGLAFLYHPRRPAVAAPCELPITLTGSPPLADHRSPVHQRTPRAATDLPGAVRHAKDKERRLTALLGARGLPGRDAIAVARVALADADDEVRLLAYALLNTQEEVIQGRIQSLTDQLAQTVPGLRLNCHKALAHCYWEAVYLGLCTGAIESMMLDSAMQQVVAAQEIAPLDAGLRLLLGRILLRQGRLDQSVLAFNQAMGLGIDSCKVAPFLDEISFINNRANTHENAMWDASAQPDPGAVVQINEGVHGHYRAAS